jgi:TolB-like protein/Tfp pilus assembly protein PilF
MSAEEDREPPLSQASTPRGAVFLSYASEDAEAAGRIATALRSAGIEVWFDKSELRGGDAWARQIRQQIRECRLFVPLISAQTDARREGYFRREWNLAVDRTHDMSDRVAFLVPVVTDDTSDSIADVPDRFREVQWTRLPAGEAPLAFVDLVRRLLSAEVSMPMRAPTGAVSEALPAVRERIGAAADSARVMLAVLPFENLSGGRKHDYFSDGLTEEMISQLARLSPHQLGVIARTSAMQYRSTNKSAQQIGRELGVSHLLEGSVRRAGERVRITTRLIRVSDETHLWAEGYERNLHDILSLQAEVARAIAREIQVKLTVRAERLLDRTAAIDPEAHEAYLRGRYLWNRRTEEGMRQSIAQYEEAIRHYPDYAMAYAGIADSYVMLACRGMMSAKETFRKARAAARKALELDGELGEAHGSLAHVRLHDWDWDGLDLDFQRAIELHPALPIVYYWYGEFLMSAGRPEDAIAVTRTAQRADPLSPVLGASLGMILYLARRYAEAVEVLQRAQDLDPQHFLPHLRLGLVRLQQRHYAEAIEELQTAARLANNSTETQSALGTGYAAAGTSGEARRIAAELEQCQLEHYVLPYNIAKIYAALGEKDPAFVWLERAYQEGNPDLIELNTEPLLDGLRSEPRFTELMRRIGFRVPATAVKR